MDNKYNISNVAKMLNISNELLRHYERKGLISPIRSQNGYRFYEENDIHLLLGIRRFRNAGFSLNEVDTLLHTGDYDDIKEMLSKRIKDLDYEIMQKKAVLDSMVKIMDDLNTLKENIDLVEVCDSPSILCIDKSHSNLSDYPDLFLRWQENMPAVHIAPFFTKKSSVEVFEDVSFGFAVPLELAEPLGLFDTPYSKVIESTKCVTLIAHSHGENFLSGSSIKHALEYCVQNNLELKDDPWGLTIGSFLKDNKAFRFHRIYLPIK